MNSARHGVGGFLLSMVLLMSVVPLAAAADGDSKSDDSKGFTFFEAFQGSSNALGQVMKLDTSVGYNFNRYFGMDVGLPFYFVRASNTARAAGATTGNGIGNAYLDLRLTVPNPAVDYASTLTGWAPTGDTTTGFSTGRFTFDWDNLLDRDFGPLRPFADVGVANTVADTPFFTRPFTTLGLVTHLEGGGSYRIIRHLRLGASVYDIVPSGQQKVFSRLRGRNGLLSAGGTIGGAGSLGLGMGRHDAGVFENAAETVGGPDIARDNGFTTWASATPISYLILEVGYNRSVRYDLNTISFGVGVNLGSLVRRARGY